MSDSKDIPIAVRVLLLGAEGSGKTTLTQQLKCLARSMEGEGRREGEEEGEVAPQFRRILEGGSIPIAPTTGQEMETILLPIPRSLLNTDGQEPYLTTTTIRGSQQRSKVRKPQHNDEGEYSDPEDDPVNAAGAVPVNMHNMHNDNIGGIGIVEDDDHNNNNKSQPPPPRGGYCDNNRGRTSSSLAHHMTTKETSVMVSAHIKEIGGRMIAVWPRFIKKAHDDPTTVQVGRKEEEVVAGASTHPPGGGGTRLAKKLLIYMIDMTNPSLLPLTCVELHGLLGNEEGVGSGCWSSLILLNKVCAPSTMSLGVVLNTLGVMHEAPDVAGWQEQLLDSSIGGPSGCRLQLSESVSLMTIDTWSGHGLVEVFNWIRGQAYST